MSANIGGLPLPCNIPIARSLLVMHTRDQRRGDSIFQRLVRCGTKQVHSCIRDTQLHSYELWVDPKLKIRCKKIKRTFEFFYSWCKSGHCSLQLSFEVFFALAVAGNCFCLLVSSYMYQHELIQQILQVLVIPFHLVVYEEFRTLIIS